MIKKFGFTLAEVLITLGIIGVVAAMTIPTLMQSTNDAELKSGYKKFMSVLNQAISMNYALDGVDFSGLTQEGNVTDDKGTSWRGFIYRRLNVIGSDESAGKYYFSDGTSIEDIKMDGCESATAPTPNCSFLIDVNGKKGPNQLTVDKTKLKDQYRVYAYNRVVSPDGTNENDPGTYILRND